jgi:hypothetical protein
MIDHMEKEKVEEIISKAREIMESFDQSGSMTIGYEGTYNLTAEQMQVIAGALYLADVYISN